MCGIAGIFDPGKRLSPDELRTVLNAMGGRLAHRGPDGAGIWMDESGMTGLSHRRLSIIDTSAAAAQPMVSRSGQSVLCFNGEIYNFQALKNLLDPGKARTWRSTGDTEVLLEALEERGPEWTLAHLEGMFAFAWWDGRNRTLWLARDRFGEKPLCIYKSENRLLFASEIKAFNALPGIALTPDLQALGLYARFGYIPAPASAFQQVEKLEPGSWMAVAADGSIRRGRYNVAGIDEPAAPEFASFDSAAGALDRRLAASVERQLIADVPVGAFLSGGVDSALICAHIAALGRTDLETFTIGFEDPAFDERQAGAAYARHLGLKHRIIPVNPESLTGAFLDVLNQFDEPLADASMFPTWLVSRAARSAVTVALTGEGGDELFGGYNRYRWALSRENPGLRSRREQVLDFFKPDREPALQAFSNAITHWPDHMLAPGVQAAPPVLAGPTPLRAMLAFDRTTYLPNDLLYKVDQASMLCSLETRIPLFSREIAAFSERLPDDWLVDRSSNKRILRKMLSRYYPDSLIMQRKMGFSVPLGRWLRTVWKPFAESLIREAPPNPVIPVAVIRQEWATFQADSTRSPFRIWNALVLLNWLKRYPV